MLKFKCLVFYLDNLIFYKIRVIGFSESDLLKKKRGYVCTWINQNLMCGNLSMTLINFSLSSILEHTVTLNLKKTLKRERRKLKFIVTWARKGSPLFIPPLIYTSIMPVPRSEFLGLENALYRQKLRVLSVNSVETLCI